MQNLRGEPQRTGQESVCAVCNRIARHTISPSATYVIAGTNALPVALSQVMGSRTPFTAAFGLLEVGHIEPRLHDRDLACRSLELLVGWGS